MNSNASINPPQTEVAESRADQHIVGLHIGIPVNVETAEFFPSKNLQATQILATLISDALAAAGLQMNPTVAGGELNDSLYLFYVRERLQAVNIIKQKLSPLALLPCSQIALLDLAEGYWRTVFPVTDKPFKDYTDAGKYLAEAARLGNLLAEWRRQREALIPSPPPKPPDREGNDGQP